MVQSSNNNQAASMIQSIGWPRLVGAVTVAIIIGYMVFALAVSGVARTKNPQLAMMLYPNESGALAARADQIFFARPDQPSKHVEKLARAALVEQSTSPKALRLLGYMAEYQQKPPRAKKLITLASKLSRREPGAQLWLIEHTARNGSTADTLRHYDTLLRTKPDSSAVLFPRLLNAINDADVRADLVPYMKRSRSWVSSFIDYALSNTKDATILASLIIENGGFPETQYSKAQNRALLLQLTSEKQFADAQKLFLLLPGAKASRLSSAAFDSFDADGRYGTIGWTINETADAAFDVDGVGANRKTTLSFGVPPVTTSEIASKFLYLQPGNYSFRARLTKLDINKGGALRWQLHCAVQKGSEPFWVINAVTNSISSAFTVAPDCPVQTLKVIASGGDEQAGLEAIISEMAVVPQSR